MVWSREDMYIQQEIRSIGKYKYQEGRNFKREGEATKIFPPLKLETGTLQGK